MYAETFQRLEDLQLRAVVKHKLTLMYGPAYGASRFGSSLLSGRWWGPFSVNAELAE